MKTLLSKVGACLLTALLAVINIACTGSMASETKDIAQTPQTFIVALDLSDRIADAQVAEKDIASITQAFEVFSKRVRDNRYIRSNDKFLVTVIPQSTTDGQVESLAQTLTIDMAAIPMNQKLKHFKELAEKLPGTLREIYRKATRPSLSDYSGANIFKFLNERLPEIAKTQSGNIKLVMVTDAYIELDNSKEVFYRGGKTNHMNRTLMSRLREGDNWRSSPCDFLMLPERLCGTDHGHSMNVVLVGLSPKGSYPFETSLLEKIWDSFLDRLQVDRHRIIPYAGCDTHMTCKSLTDALT